MTKRLWIFTGVIVAVFLGFVWINGGDKGGADTAADGGVRVVHVTGKTDAKVTLVEYSDFQCPACRAYYPVVEQVVQTYKDRISFEYRHYPLTTIHRNAFAAARASEAAGAQNKFWEMYRELFTDQQDWENAGNAQTIFEGYAQRLGLDMTKFKSDFASSATNGAINASITEFNKRGLPKATPTFLLNGKKIEPRNAEDLGKLIDKALSVSDRQ